MAEYANPDVLVTTDWVAEHMDDPDVVVVEVNVDNSLYETGHIPGAIGWNWKTQLSDTIRRDIISKEDFEQLMSKSGAERESTVILYGDSNNWFAAWAFWQIKIYGHADVRLMDGGRKKWEKEGRPMTTDMPTVSETNYKASDPDLSLRAFLPQVQEKSRERAVGLVDVRSPQEFTGEILAPPGLPETCQRGGHIPGASNIPWSKVVNDEDGTFRRREDIAQIYREQGIAGDKPIITYCRIGERSSHSWFVLKYLLGYNDVRNYDGSWTEWGNLVGAPVERGA